MEFYCRITTDILVTMPAGFHRTRLLSCLLKLSLISSHNDTTKVGEIDDVICYLMLAGKYARALLQLKNDLHIIVQDVITLASII
jgi:hypothetical protein